MVKEKKMEMAVIAGASRALKLKAMNPREDDDKILKRVSSQAAEIAENID